MGICQQSGYHGLSLYSTFSGDSRDYPVYSFDYVLGIRNPLFLYTIRAKEEYHIVYTEKKHA